MKALKKEAPWCTVCLCLAVVSCHALALYGNLLTSAAFNGIGVSTSGWSGVGLDLFKAVHAELDEIMKNVTTMLTDAINKTLQATEVIDLLVGLTGTTTDAIAEHDTTQALLQLQSKKRQRALANGEQDPDLSAMTGLIMGQIDQVLDQLMEKVSGALEALLLAIRPALEQVGQFIIQYGAKVQAILSSFSVTLDKVQKIFDDVMSSMDGGGESWDDVFYNTWTLFDYFGENNVTAEMMSLAANAYKVSALEGGKSEELVTKYDTDGSGTLQEEEFVLAAQDPSVPDLLPVVLRSYAARLSEVSGLVGQAKFRDEVATDVVSYLQLMCSKNMTKIYWIATRLSHASVPHEFTSDVMVNLAFAVDDENAIAFKDVGQVVIDAMLYMDANYTMYCYEQLFNSTYWESEGYQFSDQPVVLERVTNWITHSENAVVLSQISEDQAATPDQSEMVMLEEEVLHEMPMAAKHIAEEGMKAHVKNKMEKRHARFNQLYKSKTAQKLKLHLLGGSHASETHEDMSNAEQAIATGVPAAPTTLEFAKFLSWNSSQTANRFSGYVFDNTATSSNSIDGFAQTIEGMVKKIQSFIEQMTKFSTPAGIDDLEEKVMTFAIQGLADVTEVIKSTLGDVVEDSSEMLDDAINVALNDAGQALGEMIGGILGTPLGEALEPVIEELFTKLVGNDVDVSSISEQLSGLVSSSLEDLVAGQIGQTIADLLNDVVMKLLEGMSDVVDDVASPSLMEVDMRKHIGALHLHHKKHNKTKADPAEVAAFKEKLEQAVALAQKARDLKIAAKKGEVSDSKALRREIKAMRKQARMARLPITSRLASGCRSEQVCKTLKTKASLLAQLEEELEEERRQSGLDLTSGVWTTMTQLLGSLSNIMPLATENLKFAREEVSSLAENLGSIFMLFEEKGSPIFKGMARIWKFIWMLYFFFVKPLTSISLIYGFWAGGYFDGPGTPPVDEVEDPEKYAGFCGKLHACCDACCSCIRNFHDTQLCFWSILIILQIFALVLFLISLVFVILAAVQIMIGAGCASVYILGDPMICGDTLLSLRSFLATFMGSTSEEAFGGLCDEEKLLTWSLIGDKMFSSSIYCVAGSFLAAILTFQLLIESATLHTRAAERRWLAYMLYEKTRAHDP